MLVARTPRAGRASLILATIVALAGALAVGLLLVASPAAAAIDARSATVTVAEGNLATNSGSFSSPYGQLASSTTITTSVGSVSKSGTTSGTWSWSFRPDDGPSSSQNVVITAQHSAIFSQPVTEFVVFRLNVDNVTPTATFNAPDSVAVGDEISLSFTNVSDISSADRAAGFQFTFDCGTGSGFGAFSSASTASCPTSAPGTRTVRGQVRDKDGGISLFSDTVTILPSLSIGNARVSEKTLNARLVVGLSAASQREVTVNYATANGRATAPADYTATSGTLTFAPGQTTQTVAVRIRNDSKDERNETFFVNLSGANTTVTDAQGLATIIDNDR